MTSVRDHYEQVLAEHYSRMFGDFEAKVAEQRALLERLRRDSLSAVGSCSRFVISAESCETSIARSLTMVRDENGINMVRCDYCEGEGRA